MQQYTEKKGLYTRLELTLLSSSLGFPGDMLADKFQAQHPATEGTQEGKPVSEKMIVKLLSSGALFKRLEKVFNKYPAKYNVRLIRKAMQHIRHRSLSFADVFDARVAFELYAYEDGSGIPAELSHLQQALKMVERIMSPSKLQMEIQRYSEVADVPSRLQMYEFFDIVALCGRTETEEKRRLSETSLQGSYTAKREGTFDLALPDFDEMLMTTDQKVTAYLEAKYRQSLYRKPDPTPAPLVTDRIIRTSSRRSLTSLASDQSRAITPCIEHSQSQLHRVRSGFYVFSEPQFCALHGILEPPASKEKVLPTKHRVHDPLNRVNDTRNGTHHKPVRVRLQRLPQRKMEAKHPAGSAARTKSVSENLKSTINDICADSVLRARDALDSSLAVVPPHLQVYQSPPGSESSSGSKQKPTVVSKVVSGAQSVQRADRPILKHVVSDREWEEHQGLIDELQWMTMRMGAHENN